MATSRFLTIATAAGVVVSTAFGPVCQAQVKDLDQLTGAWAVSDATGKMDTFLKVTCNDLWDLTAPGKPPVKARGALRIVKVGDGYVVGENRSILSLKREIAAEPLKITQAGATTTLQWSGSRRLTRRLQSALGEPILEVRDSPTAVTNYYVQCPVLPGKTVNDPWNPPTFSYPSFNSCQVLGEQVVRRNTDANIKARYASYAESWRKAIDEMMPPADRAAALPMVAQRWNVTGDALTTLIGREIDRCGGPAPGFLPAAPYRAPPPVPGGAK